MPGSQNLSWGLQCPPPHLLGDLQIWKCWTILADWSLLGVWEQHSHGKTGLPELSVHPAAVARMGSGKLCGDSTVAVGCCDPPWSGPVVPALQSLGSVASAFRVVGSALWPRVWQPRSQEQEGLPGGGCQVQRGRHPSYRRVLAVHSLLLFSKDLSASSLTLFKKRWPWGQHRGSVERQALAPRGWIPWVLPVSHLLPEPVPCLHLRGHLATQMSFGCPHRGRAWASHPPRTRAPAGQAMLLGYLEPGPRFLARSRLLRLTCPGLVA